MRWMMNCSGLFVKCEHCLWVVWGLSGCVLTAMMESELEKAPESPPPHQWADNSCTPSTTANRSGMTSDTTRSQTVWTEDPENKITEGHKDSSVNSDWPAPDVDYTNMAYYDDKMVMNDLCLTCNSLVNCSSKPKSLNHKPQRVYCIFIIEQRLYSSGTSQR